MIVQVRYLAQLRQSAGRSVESVEVADGCTVAGLIEVLSILRQTLRVNLVDAKGGVRTSLLIFIGDQQVHAGHVLHPGDEVTLMTPIAGGGG